MDATAGLAEHTYLVSFPLCDGRSLEVRIELTDATNARGSGPQIQANVVSPGRSPANDRTPLTLRLTLRRRMSHDSEPSTPGRMTPSTLDSQQLALPWVEARAASGAVGRSADLGTRELRYTPVG